ncbi:hypothetical protein M514_03315 [Trichuris suis]|uniref:Uncharacterized protein n=1 Tax=Trichuris suis TaxID=68888 RepID=A0A085MF80_9BILA|nr:hypothetical protein M513_03315 [Trichuris suis]KFD70216.1 hypothetical protein M514_03315 [Trichuris suis]
MDAALIEHIWASWPVKENGWPVAEKTRIVNAIDVIWQKSGSHCVNSGKRIQNEEDVRKTGHSPLLRRDKGLLLVTGHAVRGKRRTGRKMEKPILPTLAPRLRSRRNSGRRSNEMTKPVVSKGTSFGKDKFLDTRS